MSAATLKWRGDLVVSRQGTPDQPAFVVKDPASGRFYRLREAEHFIAGQLDGSTTTETIRERVQQRFGTTLSEQSLEQFIHRLNTLGLVADAARPLQRPASRPRRIAGDLFYLRVKAFDPDRLLERLARPFSFLFTPAFVTLSALLIVSAIGLTVLHWPEMAREMSALLRVESLPLAWGICFLVILAHEFAHGLTCKHFGGSVRELGFMLIYLQPAFYCNVSDAWQFPEKSRRLWVTFAGAYFELFLWAGATWVWRVTDPATTLNYLALVIAATSAIKSIFNFNPLIKLDGYYLLSDWLEIPNLRRKAFACLGSLSRRWFAPLPQWLKESTARELWIYFGYGLLAGIYSVALLSFVLWQLTGFLVDRYQAWGFVVSVALIGAVLRNPLSRSIQTLRLQLSSSQRLVRAVKRLVALILVLGGITAGLYYWPMELKVAGPFTLLPIHNADVRAEVEGLIQSVYHDEGESVAQGEVLARLADRDCQAELRKIKAELEEKQARLRLLRAGPRVEEVELAKTTIAKEEERLKFATQQLNRDEALIKQQLLARKDFETTAEQVSVRSRELQEARDHLKVLLAGSRPEEIEALEAELRRLDAHQSYLQEQLRLLTLRSPVAGVITTRKLREKIGQHVKKGDLLAEVHELNTVTAEIDVPEKEIADVRVGQRVALKARAHPGASFEGTVVAIAPVASKPEDSRGQRTVLVTTQLDNASGLLKPQMSGMAKIYCGERRALELLGRRLVRYLRVEVWSWW